MPTFYNKPVFVWTMFASIFLLLPQFWTVSDTDTPTTAYAFPIFQQHQRYRNHHRQQRQQQQKQQQRRLPKSVSSLSFGTGKVPCAVIPTPYFAENGDNNTNNNNDDAAKPAATTTALSNDDTLNNNNDTVAAKSMSTSKSTFQMIDELAQQLKISALRANAKAAIYTTTATERSNSRNNYQLVFTKYRYYLQACICYTLFLLYRAYRGFFIILPAVFRETFRKLQAAVDDTPFDDYNESVASSSSSNFENKVSSPDGVIQPKPMTVRTRITISIISMFVLGTYVMGGAIRVTSSLVKSIINGSGIVQSLQHAIQIQERNEISLLQKSTTAAVVTTTTTNTDESARGSIVNGFAP